jgi:pyruvate kinase
MAAAAEIGGFAAARVAVATLRPAAHPAPAAAPQQPRRAVAAQSLRTTATEALTADLAGTTNGAVHARVSAILKPV